MIPRTKKLILSACLLLAGVTALVAVILTGAAGGSASPGFKAVVAVQPVVQADTVPPTVTSVVRANFSPSNAAIVSFNVIFSEPSPALTCRISR